jgi:PKHD-type hydroxylase
MKKFRLLTEPDCAKLREAIIKIEPEDGLRTAGSYVKDVKNNRQLTGNVEAARPILKAIEDQLFKSPEFRVHAYPKTICRTMINIHAVDEFYGKHVDNVFVRNGTTSARGDLSFTLFLEDPSKYEGGELRIYSDVGTVDIKLKAGEVFLYDSGLLHEVRAVTSGTRIGFVGWIQSWIPDSRARTNLTALDVVIAKLKKNHDLPRDTLDELHRIYNEILRSQMR